MKLIDSEGVLLNASEFEINLYNIDKKYWDPISETKQGIISEEEYKNKDFKIVTRMERLKGFQEKRIADMKQSRISRFFGGRKEIDYEEEWDKQPKLFLTILKPGKYLIIFDYNKCSYASIINITSSFGRRTITEIKPRKFKTCGFGRLETFIRVNSNFIITLFHVMGKANVFFLFFIIND